LAALQWLYQGPVFVDVVPLVHTLPRSLLTQQLAYGQTVWRDAQGAWHQQFAPSFDQLVGADRVYSGGRDYLLTQAQGVELLNAGFGAYLTPYPPGASSNLVGAAVVGASFVG
jgi:hypothetical protein